MFDGTNRRRMHLLSLFIETIQHVLQRVVLIRQHVRRQVAHHLHMRVHTPALPQRVRPHRQRPASTLIPHTPLEGPSARGDRVHVTTLQHHHLVHVRVLALEVVAQRLRHDRHVVLRLVVQNRVVEHAARKCEILALRRQRAAEQSAVDRAQIHRVFDDVEVIGDVERHGVHRVQEGSRPLVVHQFHVQAEAVLHARSDGGGHVVGGGLGVSGGGRTYGTRWVQVASGAGGERVCSLRFGGGCVVLLDAGQI